MASAVCTRVVVAAMIIPNSQPKRKKMIRPRLRQVGLLASLGEDCGSAVRGERIEERRASLFKGTPNLTDLVPLLLAGPSQGSPH